MTYEIMWNGRFLLPVSSLSELCERLRSEADRLEEMEADGIELASESSDVYLLLITDSSEVAKKYDMINANEMDDDRDDQYDVFVNRDNIDNEFDPSKLKLNDEDDF